LATVLQEANLLASLLAYDKYFPAVPAE